MVFTKDKHPHKWTLEEKKKLLELWKSESDWTERSKKMYEAFPNRKYKGFFSAGTCHTEFDRLVHAPAPAQVTIPTSSSTAGYSLKTLVDIWIEYYNKEIEKDIDRQLEMCMVEIRSCYALVERIENDDPKLTDDQLLALVEEARAEDAKKDSSNNLVINAYMRRLMVVEDEKKKGNKQSTSVMSRPAAIPPTKSAGTLPRGSETAFRSPSPGSPMKSPIRRVAEAIREGITPVKTDTPTKLDQVQSTSPQRPLEVLFFPVKSPTPVKAVQTPLKRLSSPEQTPQKGEVSVKQELMEIEPSTPIETIVDSSRSRSDSVRSRRRGDTENKEETPVKGRSTRTKVTRNKEDMEEEKIPERPTTAGGTDSSKNQKSSSRMSTRKNEAVKKETDSETASIVAEEPTEKFTNGECQTDIAIIGSFHSVPEKKERRASTTRKTRSNTKEEEPVVEESTDRTRDIAVQCSRLELDREDKIVITWFDNEKSVLIRKSVKKELGDEEDVLLEEDVEEVKGKAGGKREVTLIYDVEDWVAKSLLLNPGVELEEEDSSISKRARENLRKDEKSKEEGIQMKVMLTNTLECIRGHKHSAVFLHPVLEKEAPGYANTIKQRMDLLTMKRDIDSGEIANPKQLKHALMRMYANAVMYNSTDHEVNTLAKEMARDSLAEFTRLIGDGQKTISSLPANANPKRGKIEEHSARPTRAQLEGIRGKKQDEESGSGAAARAILRRKRPAK